MANTPENHQPVTNAGDPAVAAHAEADTAVIAEATQPETVQAALPTPTGSGAQPQAVDTFAAQAQAQVQAQTRVMPAAQAPVQPQTPVQAPAPGYAQSQQHAYGAPVPQMSYPAPTQPPQFAHSAQQPQALAPQQGQTSEQFSASFGQPAPGGFEMNGAGDGGGSGTTGGPGSPANAQPKSRTGMLLAGLAIGALLGGVVGGGVAAVVSANSTQQVVSQTASGSLTLNNADTATNITGVAAVATPSVVTLEVSGGNTGGSGSGVIYSEDGYIVTNAHVVTLDGAAVEAPKIRVKLSDGRVLDGTLIDIDPYADLAVVKVEAEGLPAIKMADSDKLNVGDLTVAIGAPLNLANTVTTGVVSSLYRGIAVGSTLIPQTPTTPEENGGQSDQGNGNSDSDSGQGLPWDFRFGLPDQGQSDGGSQGGQQQQQSTTTSSVTLPVIQTDASINPGNSGGALLNGNGELIGINVAIASPTSSDGVAGSAGLGFAIPSNLVTRVADAIIAGEQPSHGLMGASVADSSQDTDEDANHAGGLLVDVIKGGGAEKAGLRAGDVVTAVNGVPATDGTSVSALVRMNAGGSTVVVDYTRGGKPGQTEVTLGTLEW